MEKNKKVIKPEFIFKKNKNKLAWRKIEDTLVLLYIPTNEIYELNRTGAYIWDKIDGKKNIKEIIVEMCTKFNINYTQNLKRDIIKFIEKLCKWDIIKIKK
ncbi:MAG: PqqD family protein [Candidatus Omnitrophica bacterium]|nr:PqqD family protein [Candidatus Omnitrophota bacterium]